MSAACSSFFAGAFSEDWASIVGAPANNASEKCHAIFNPDVAKDKLIVSLVLIWLLEYLFVSNHNLFSATLFVRYAIECSTSARRQSYSGVKARNCRPAAIDFL